MGLCSRYNLYLNVQLVIQISILFTLFTPVANLAKNERHASSDLGYSVFCTLPPPPIKTNFICDYDGNESLSIAELSLKILDSLKKRSDILIPQRMILLNFKGF